MTPDLGALEDDTLDILTLRNGFLKVTGKIKLTVKSDFLKT